MVSPWEYAGYQEAIKRKQLMDQQVNPGTPLQAPVRRLDINSDPGLSDPAKASAVDSDLARTLTTMNNVSGYVPEAAVGRRAAPGPISLEDAGRAIEARAAEIEAARVAAEAEKAAAAVTAARNAGITRTSAPTLPFSMGPLPNQAPMQIMQSPAPVAPTMTPAEWAYLVNQSLGVGQGGA
jgi:hypothetical protein